MLHPLPVTPAVIQALSDDGPKWMAFRSYSYMLRMELFSMIFLELYDWITPTHKIITTCLNDSDYKDEEENEEQETTLTSLYYNVNFAYLVFVQKMFCRSKNREAIHFLVVCVCTSSIANNMCVTHSTRYGTI